MFDNCCRFEQLNNYVTTILSAEAVYYHLEMFPIYFN